MKKHKVVTIGREYGSGGRIVAQKVAEALGVPFYDKELIEMAAMKTGLSESFVKKAEEQRASGFLYSLYFSAQSLPLYDQVFIAQSDIIRKAAAEGACVIVGRCADYVLHDVPNCLHVFIHAPFEERMCRAREAYGIAAEDAKAVVIRHDKDRASYYSHFAMGKWGKTQNYDLTINSAMGLDRVADTIVRLASSGEGDA